MRWLADECMAAGLVAALRASGHEVAYVAEITPRATDAEILSLAQEEHGFF